MNTMKIKINPNLAIPGHLQGEVQSKLAYVDESIQHAEVNGTSVELDLTIPDGLDDNETEILLQSIEKKVHLVVDTMASGAIQPKQSILEDHLDREVQYSVDPLETLKDKQQVFGESPGIYTLGPLVSSLISFFESAFLDLAGSFNAVSYRFPTLISAEYLDRVNYFSAFPHSLSFVTHLREDVQVINRFAEQTCWENNRLAHDCHAAETHLWIDQHGWYRCVETTSRGPPEAGISNGYDQAVR